MAAAQTENPKKKNKSKMAAGQNENPKKKKKLEHDADETEYPKKKNKLETPADQAENPKKEKELGTADDDAQKIKKKSKKKAKKDKWGQPIVSEDSINHSKQEEYVVEEEAQEVEPVKEKKKNGKSENFEPNKVVVSGMPYTTTEVEIREFFKDIGTLEQLQLSKFPDTGYFSGLAFVTFQTKAEVTSALNLDGAKMGTRIIKIERCRGDPQRKRKTEFLTKPEKVEGNYSVYVGNLSWEITEDDIQNFFSKSKIKSIRFAVNKSTGKFRGFGHVDFEDDESLEEAVKKNQVELHGRPVKVDYAVCNRN